LPYPDFRWAVVERHAFRQTVPETAGVIVTEQEAVAPVFVGAIRFQCQFLNLVVIIAGIAVGRCGDVFQQLYPFLGGVKVGRPVEEDGVGIDLKPCPFLKIDTISSSRKR
jgi:hypothetical protein